MPTFVPQAPLASVHREVAHLLPRGAKVLVAVSGGPDSQVLLDHLALLRRPLQLAELWAVGIDHQLRAGAAHELKLAEALAHSHHVPFYHRRVQLAAGHNRLAAARQARYQALRRLGRQLGATHLATGHTATDQVETLLMHLCRGSSLRGAGAIRAQHRGVVRPLLGIGRGDVLAWLAARHIDFAQDPSNADGRRARARLRADVLPVLAQLNRQFEAHIGAFCAEAQDEEAWLQRRAKRLLQQLSDAHHSLDGRSLKRLVPLWRRRVLALWLRQVGATPTRRALAAVWALAQAPEGHAHHAVSLGGANICCQRGRLYLSVSKPRRLPSGVKTATSSPVGSASAARLVVPSSVPLGPHQMLRLSEIEPAELPASLHTLDHASSVRRQMADGGAQTVAFDADRLHFELSLRPWQQGDKVRPFGLKGRIKVGDLFTNHKVPRVLRLGWPLLMCGDEVLWVIGLRRSAHAPITATTRRIVTLKVEDLRAAAQDRP